MSNDNQCLYIPGLQLHVPHHGSSTPYGSLHGGIPGCFSGLSTITVEVSSDPQPPTQPIYELKVLQQNDGGAQGRLLPDFPLIRGLPNVAHALSLLTPLSAIDEGTGMVQQPDRSPVVGETQTNLHNFLQGMKEGQLRLLGDHNVKTPRRPQRRKDMCSCGRMVYKDQRARHLLTRTHTEEGKQHTCFWCRKGLARKDSLRRHFFVACTKRYNPSLKDFIWNNWRIFGGINSRILQDVETMDDARQIVSGASLPK